MVWYLIVLEEDGRADGVQKHSVWTPAELVAQGVVGTLGGGKTTTERAVGLHLFSHTH